MEPEPRGALSQSAEAPAASAEASAEAPAALYADRVRHFDARVADKTGSVRLYSRLRLATFATTITGAWLLFQSGRGTEAWLFMSGGILAFRDPGRTAPGRATTPAPRRVDGGLQPGGHRAD